jgi:lipopolysaccharide transport system ATP-binding protein
VTAIKVEGLWKRYRIGARESPAETFRELLTTRARGLLRRIRGNGNPRDDNFWALRGVSCKVEGGEIVGVIGRNGAGKTTLLKVLSRITWPTLGRAEIRGRVASLLEVGTGFHPELTGRENIYVNGAIFGMGRRQIDAVFDHIVEFAEIGPFLDTPVKRYSSGMYVRLGFSVAAHVDADVLLVDEVLSVGDFEFQERCVGKIGDVSRGGRTVVVVSHSMGVIQTLCEKVILLKDGQVDFIGPTGDGVRRYLQQGTLTGPTTANLFEGPLAQRIRIEAILVNGQPLAETIVVSPGSAIAIELRGEASADIRRCELIVGIEKRGVRVATLRDTRLPEALRQGPFRSELVIPALFLRPGDYVVSVGGVSESLREWMLCEHVGRFSILEEWSEESRANMEGLVNVPFRGLREQ